MELAGCLLFYICDVVHEIICISYIWGGIIKYIKGLSNGAEIENKNFIKLLLTEVGGSIMELKNPFALRKTDGHIVMIGDLSPEQRGKACGCICPECKADFIARMGEERAPHFAHNGNACDAVKVFLNSLYQIMWEGLQENTCFSLPGCYGFFQESTGVEKLSSVPFEGCESIFAVCDFNVEFSEIRKNNQGVAEALIIRDKKEHFLAVVLVPPATICKIPRPKPVEGIATIVIRIPETLDFHHETSNQLKRILLQEKQDKEWLSSPKINKWSQQCAEKRKTWLEHRREEQERIVQEKQSSQVKEISRQNEEADRKMVEILGEYRASQFAIWDYNNDEKLSAIRFWLSRNYSEIPNDFQVEDPYGERWCYCTTCKQWYQSTDMTQYGGIGDKLNSGRCRECTRRSQQ